MKNKTAERPFFYLGYPYFFNTHFDHQAQLPPDSKVLLTGDSNVQPESPPYLALSQTMHDSALVAKAQASKGTGTFNGFGRDPANPNLTIDYIFVSKNLMV